MFGRMMKLLAYLLMVGAVALGIDASHDQLSGHARAITPDRGSRIVEATAKDNPSDFKGIIAYEWIRAAALFGGGLFFLNWVRRAEKLDPFST